MKGWRPHLLLQQLLLRQLCLDSCSGQNPRAGTFNDWAKASSMASINFLKDFAIRCHKVDQERLSKLRPQFCIQWDSCKDKDCQDILINDSVVTIDSIERIKGFINTSQNSKPVFAKPVILQHKPFSLLPACFPSLLGPQDHCQKPWEVFLGFSHP